LVPKILIGSFKRWFHYNHDFIVTLFVQYEFL